ncbi:MAG: hypothetical protein ACK5N8_00275 [Alphaproteobacteria bacterium]
MDIKYLIMVLTFIFSLTLSFFLLSLINKKISNGNMNKKSTFAFLTLYGITAISLIILYFVLYDPYLLKYNFEFLDLFTALTFSGLIFGTYSFKNIEKLAPFILALGCVAVTYFIPENYHIFDIEMPIYAEKILLGLGLFIFSLIYRYINTIDGILATQSGFIGIGVMGLSMILNIALLGAFGSIFLATSIALLSFNKYPAKIEINTAMATSSAFLLGWFLLKTGEETSLTCSLLLISFVIIEVTIAFLKRLTFMEKYKDIYNNGFCMRASVRGLYPDSIRFAVSKVMALSVLLACFQTFSPNLYSVPLFGSFAVLWILYKMQEWEYYSQPLKELNKETLDSVKENFDEIKKYIKKD